MSRCCVLVFFCLWFRRTQACSTDDKNAMLRAAIARSATCIAPSTAWGPQRDNETKPDILGVLCRHFTGQPQSEARLHGHLIALWGWARLECCRRTSQKYTAMSTDFPTLFFLLLCSRTTIIRSPYSSREKTTGSMKKKIEGKKRNGKHTFRSGS